MMNERGKQAPFIHFENLSGFAGITHAVSARHGPAFGQVGTDHATAKAADECAQLLDKTGTAWVHQVHGNVINKTAIYLEYAKGVTAQVAKR